MYNLFFRKNRNFVILLFVMFIFNFGYSSLIPIFPVYFKSQGMTPIMVGFLLSLYAITKALVHIPSSFVLDKFYKDRILEICFLLFGILFIFYYLSNKVISFAIIRFIEGVVAGISFPVIYSLLSSNIKQNKRGEYMGIFTTVSSLGLAIGPLLTGMFIKLNITTNKTFLIAAILSFLGSGLIYVFYDHKDEIFQKNINDNEEYSMFSFFKNNFVFLLGVGIIGFIGDFIFSSISMSVPMIFDNVYSGSSEYGAFLLSINFVVFAFFSPFAGKIIDKLGAEKCLNFSMIGICILFFIIFIIENRIIFMILLTLEFFFASLLFTSNQVKAMELETQINASGKIFAIVGTFQSIGFSVGPLLTGVTYDYNIKFSFLLTSILIGVILFVRMMFIKSYNKV